MKNRVNSLWALFLMSMGASLIYAMNFEHSEIEQSFLLNERAQEASDLKIALRSSLQSEESITILEKLSFAGLFDYKVIRYFICVMNQSSQETQESIRIVFSNVLNCLQRSNKNLERIKENNPFEETSDEFSIIHTALGAAHNIDEDSVKQSILAIKLAMLELPNILQGAYC